MSRRIEREKRVVEQMVRLYCRRKERNGTLCSECEATLRYALARLDKCPFGDEKPTCRRCTVHCYTPEQRRRIRKIMRWAGPRMIIYHPVATIRHSLRELL